MMSTAQNTPSDGNKLSVLCEILIMVETLGGALAFAVRLPLAVPASSDSSLKSEGIRA